MDGCSSGETNLKGDLMAKSVARRSAGDALTKVCAQRFSLPKKTLKKAVQEATIRLVADRIAKEEIDSSWKEVIGRTKRRRRKPRAASPKK